MTVPEVIKTILEPWSSLYEGSKVVTSLTRFVHLGGLLLGGGAAVAADRAAMRAARGADDVRRCRLALARHVHRVVLTGLALIVTSGLLMLASDLEAFLSAPVYWIKMALVLTMLVNGYVITRIEPGLRADASSGWTALRRASIASFGLWFAIVLAGTALMLVA